PEMARLLRITPRDSVLDVGEGITPFAYAQVAADPFRPRLPRRQRVISRGPEYVRASAEALPFADRAFDFVWCQSALERAADPGRACEELQRVTWRGFLETVSPYAEMAIP